LRQPADSEDEVDLMVPEDGEVVSAVDFKTREATAEAELDTKEAASLGPMELLHQMRHLVQVLLVEVLEVALVGEAMVEIATALEFQRLVGMTRAAHLMTDLVDIEATEITIGEVTSRVAATQSPCDPESIGTEIEMEEDMMHDHVKKTHGNDSTSQMAMTILASCEDIKYSRTSLGLFCGGLFRLFFPSSPG